MVGTITFFLCYRCCNITFDCNIEIYTKLSFFLI